MLWMIVNCLAISRGCERDKSTIKFDRPPPTPPPPPPHPLSLPSVGLIFPFLCLRLTPTSPAQFIFILPFSLLHKQQFRGGEVEISSLWLRPTVAEDFRELAPLSLCIDDSGESFSWSDFHVLT